MMHPVATAPRPLRRQHQVPALALLICLGEWRGAAAQGAVAGSVLMEGEVMIEGMEAVVGAAEAAAVARTMASCGTCPLSLVRGMVRSWECLTA
jgi:hypothetical protein